MAKKVKPLLEVSQNQIFDNSTSEITTTRKALDDYYTDILTWKQKPCSIEFIERTAEDLTKWAFTAVQQAEEDGATGIKKSLKLSQFYRAHGLYSRDIRRFKKKSEKFRIAHQEALLAIGDKREILALTGEIDAGYVRSSQHRYDPEDKESLIFLAILKSLSCDDKTDVVEDIKKKLDEWKQKLQPIPDTEEVRKKLEADERRSKITNEQVSL